MRIFAMSIFTTDTLRYKARNSLAKLKDFSVNYRELKSTRKHDL